jgi:hypothetical protein
MELNKYSMLSSERADGSNKFNENKFVFNHPFTHDECFNRLVKEAEKYNNGIIVAFDFDHTIFNYREYGDKLEEIVKDNKAEEAAYMCVVELLKAASNVGIILVLYTAEKDRKRLEVKKEFCKQLGINYTFVNESPVMKGTNKPYFNLILDDRAGLEESFNILSRLVIKLSDMEQINK